jgi:hypothetical protein
MNSRQPAERECRQNRLDRRDPDLQIHSSAERRFERSRQPIARLAEFIQHDLSAGKIEVGEAFFGAIEEHRETA